MENKIDSTSKNIRGRFVIQEIIEPTFKEKVALAKKQIAYLKEMTGKIDDESVSKDLDDITKQNYIKRIIQKKKKFI